GVFNGTFDGGGYNITRSNLVITDEINSDKTYFGLFEVNNGTIKNVNLKQSGTSSHQNGINKTSWIYVGMIAGRNNGMIDNCNYDGVDILMAIFYLNQYSGGIVGYNTGTIKNCSANQNSQGYGHKGGITGYNSTTGVVQNCRVYGR